jgi:hypothetical protein
MTGYPIETGGFGGLRNIGGWRIGEKGRRRGSAWKEIG